MQSLRKTMPCELRLSSSPRSWLVRGEEDNLNSQGMVFRKLCMSDLKKPEELEEAAAEGAIPKEPVLELVYGWIARLSALAAGCEIKARNSAV